jgi:hypothetical protein
MLDEHRANFNDEARMTNDKGNPNTQMTNHSERSHNLQPVGPSSSGDAISGGSRDSFVFGRSRGREVLVNWPLRGDAT